MAGEDKFIKKAGTKISYTREQLEELKKCMHPLTGPMYFAETFAYIQHPTRGSILFTPYDFQRELIDCYHRNRYSIALVSRQQGKTTVAAIYLLWYAMFMEDSMILIASKSGADSSEIMGKVRYAYENLPDHIRAGVREYNKKSMMFDNGSRILSATTTPNTGRGMALSLIYLDEFAFVEPPRVARDLWTALSPALSTGGKVMITSTPNSLQDQFSEIWLGSQDKTDEYGNPNKDGLGRNGFASYFATWRANPERDEKWATNERNKIGEERFKREHENEFIVFEETLINAAKLNDLKVKEPIEHTGKVRWYEKIDHNMTYVAALDPSMGTGGDNAAITVWELPTMKQVAEWYNNKTPIEGQIRILRELLIAIWEQGQPEIYWSLENNSIGEAGLVVIRESGEESFPGTFLHDPNTALSLKHRRKGFLTTAKTKQQACAKLKHFIETNAMGVSSENVVSELKNYIAIGNTYRAKSGMTDDLVSSALLFVRMAVFIASWDDKVSAATSSDISDMEDDDRPPHPMLIL